MATMAISVFHSGSKVLPNHKHEKNACVATPPWDCLFPEFAHQDQYDNQYAFNNDQQTNSYIYTHNYH